jgi:hypothetical protein
MAVPISPKAKLAVLSVILGLALLAVYAFFAYLTDPEATDGCLVEYEECRAVAAGLTGALDCGIELYHCRVLGEHVHSENGTHP